MPAMATATAGLTIAQFLGVPAGSPLAVRSTSDPFVVGTAGALVEPRIVRRVGQGRALLGGSACYVLVYAVVAASPVRWARIGLLAGAFVGGGALFPVMMSLFQELTVSTRGRVSALASVLMYAGSTLTGIVGGPLLAALPSSWGVSLLALGTTLVTLGPWAASGSRRS
ncbi:MFS transporter [Actinomyces israelii]|uniref:hypothetical protein n=1 Tax=Actinomyces israelii TaxID=1659 RepID=UPI00255314A4|nr:hypothetical protein [Actinomyces israelii]WKR21315.1 hypothetical protein AIF0345_1220 [Actinomyces israelii]